MMNLTEFFNPSGGQFDCHHHLFNCPKCAALHVDSWRNPRYGIWLLYYILKGPTNVIVATFIAAIVGSCISRILVSFSRRLSWSLCCPFSHPWFLDISPIGPLPSLSVANRQAVTSVTLVVILALVISIGMASGSVVLKLYHSYQRHQKKNDQCQLALVSKHLCNRLYFYLKGTMIVK